MTSYRVTEKTMIEEKQTKRLLSYEMLRKIYTKIQWEITFDS